MENLTQYKQHPKSLVKTVEQQPQQDNYAIYNKQCTFKLENYGLIKMLFLKFTIDTDLVSSFPIPTSPYLINDVSLNCNGMSIARANTTYTLSRIDRLKGTSLYDQMINACTIQEDPWVGPQTISLPLFFWPIDGQMFNPADYQNLTVSVITKTSKEAMGFEEDLTLNNIKLFTIYEQMESYVKKPLKNSYNITQDLTRVASGVSRTIVKLNNPSEILSLNFMLRKVSNGGVIGIINSVVVDCPTGNIGTFDNLTNFDLNTSVGKNDGSTFQIDFSEYIKSNRNMFPLICTVNHATTGEAYDLYTTYEYRSVILEENGFMLETFDEML